MKQILFVDDKPAIGKVLSVYLGKENELVYFEDPVRAIEWPVSYTHLTLPTICSV